MKTQQNLNTFEKSLKSAFSSWNGKMKLKVDLREEGLEYSFKELVAPLRKKHGVLLLRSDLPFVFLVRILMIEEDQSYIYVIDNYEQGAIARRKKLSKNAKGELFFTYKSKFTGEKPVKYFLKDAYKVKTAVV